MADKITVVVVWYKRNQLDDFLRSISGQKEIDVIVIPLDNSQNQYAGAREAFNSVINKIDTEYVMFAHPDICFEDDNVLEKLLSESWSCRCSGMQTGKNMENFVKYCAWRE